MCDGELLLFMMGLIKSLNKNINYVLRKCGVLDTPLA